MWKTALGDVMRTQHLLPVLLVPVLLSGCVVDARRADTVIGPERRLDLPLTGVTRVLVRIPVGDIEIEAADDDRLTAEMIIKCPDRDSRCARRLADVALISELRGETLVVRSSKNSSMNYREGNVRTVVRVPEVARLDVDVTAGDLNVSNVSACLSIDMGAGDVDVSVPARGIAGVALDAGIGDASLRVNDRHRSAPRSLLVGAELDWHEGTGDCEMDVDLQVGDISVELLGDPI
jgi:hypothetical protein